MRTTSTPPLPRTGTRRHLAALVSSTGVLAVLAVAAQSPPPPDRVARLVAAMTLDEKESMLHGAADPDGIAGAGYIVGVPRLGIPALRLADGPAGIRTTRPATALPAPIALAATFDPELARQYGRVLGLEARAHGQHVLLAPMVNLVRVPQAGRNFEALGEDPLLAAALGAAQVAGIQAAGAIATVKHFAANNHEAGRTTADVRADERTLREGELRPFEAAVAAGAGAVMASLNRVNGTYASESQALLTGILKRQWGFQGFVVSDWGATHSAAPALLAGLDVEMPRGTHFGGLGGAVSSGQVPLAAIDAAVTRILRQMDRIGLLAATDATPAASAPGTTSATPADVRAHAQIARDLATAGSVLLRNDGGLLPLRAQDLASMTIIGPTARVALVGGGGSARVTAVLAESPLAALRRRAGPAAHVRLEPGIDLDGVAVPADALGGDAIDATRTRALPAGTTRTWNATLRVPADGDYTLMLQADRGQATLQIDDEIVIGGAEPGPVIGPRLDGVFGGIFRPSVIDTVDGLQVMRATRRLERARAYAVVVTATAPANASQHMRLAWVTPDMRRTRLADAVTAARTARVAVVFAHNEGTEGRDRDSLALPADQDALIAAVAAVNPRTIVVLNTGDPVAMPWLARVRAVLVTWYPGQEGGAATAAMLAGDVSPGGKLPVTFPARLDDAPTFPPERYPGVDDRVDYSEGVFFGYRWYDRARLTPLFPFGHGLSYTRFSYGGLSVRTDNGQVAVSFTVRNTGDRAGTDVAQVYVEPPADAAVPLPIRALAGFARLTLRPGERRAVTITLDERTLSYWSDADRSWVRLGGRAFVVGSSSRDVRLRGVF